VVRFDSCIGLTADVYEVILAGGSSGD